MSHRVSDVLNNLEEKFLVNWKLKNPKTWQKISQEAMNVGSIVDQYVQDDINGIQPPENPTNPYVINCVTAWQKFKVDHPEFYQKAREHKANMQRELVMGELVGHPDFIFDDELPDLKTSKRINKTHWMQVAQYAKMVSSITDDITPEPIKKISILRLDKYDEKGVYEYKVLEEPFITFWQSKFEARYQVFKEEGEFRELMRKKLEGERLA